MSCTISSCIILCAIIRRLAGYCAWPSMHSQAAMTEQHCSSGRKTSSADSSRSSLSAAVCRTVRRWEPYACLREEICAWQAIRARRCGSRSLRSCEVRSSGADEPHAVPENVPIRRKTSKNAPNIRLKYKKRGKTLKIH